MNWEQQVADFKVELKPQTSVISTQAIRFGFFGSVGGGKSVTAGIFAIGITPTGLIGWVDGEGERSGWAIDDVSDKAVKKYGGTKAEWKARFKVVHVGPPFNPLRVVAAVQVLEEQGCKTIILDIMSQAWDSDGGYLDLKNEELDKMAGDDEGKRSRSLASAAAHVKPWTHQKLVNKVTTSSTNLVLLFQAKQKYNVNTHKPDDFQSPIQESGLTRTALAVGLVQADDKGIGGHCSFQLPMGQGTKFTHPSILATLPRNGEQFTFEHAEGILRLCGGSPASKPAATANFDALRQAAEGKAIELLDVEIKDVVSEKWKDKDVYKITFSNGQICSTLDKKLGETAMAEIETGLRFMATYEPTPKGGFKLLTLEPMEGPIP
jgi:hypothetical protein